jgi:hypothetical protein
MGAGREMQVRRVALDDLEQKIGEVKAHYRRYRPWTAAGAAYGRQMDDRMIA